MTLEAARVTVSYTGRIVDGSPQVSRLDAAGGVTVTRPDQSARGNYAVYDLNRRVITMIGGVTMTHGGNTVNGGRTTTPTEPGPAAFDGAATPARRPAAGCPPHTSHPPPPAPAPPPP